MELVVRGRNVVVPDHYRQHVADKLEKIERYDHKIIRTDVELQHERNPRQTGRCQHVEITCRTRGPVVRSEACAEDFYKALDQAVERLERRFRQAADRRRVHHGRRTPPSIADVVATGVPPVEAVPDIVEAEPDYDGPGRVVREKLGYPAGSAVVPLDQRAARVAKSTWAPVTAWCSARLMRSSRFVSSDANASREPVHSRRASVVYRRHAYDYGLIRLAD